MCKLLIFATLLGILMMGLGVFLTTPQRTGEFIIDHELGTAEVYIQDNGIPHILADNRRIGAFALGYVHAKDRIWQIELMRRVAQGRLSEVFG